MTDPTIKLLQDLVAIDSVNPSLVPGGAGESAVAERVAEWMRSWGLDVAVTDAAPGRPNVFGVIEGARGGKSLMLCGHSDTVGVEGMTAPFDPVIRDGKLFGRGAQDMKGGVAAILDAARKLAASPTGLKGRVIVAIVADEEYASIGAEAAVKDWTADAAIVAEPTDLAIGIGHKGFEWVEVETHGVAAHGSRPDDGVDAIVMMGRVLAGLESLEQHFIAAAPHPILGRASVHASLVSGGRELSTYPDRCKLSIERRTVTGEPPRSLLREVADILDRLRAADPRFRAEARFLFDRSPYLTPEKHPLPSILRDSLDRKTTTGALSFWTDAAIIGGAGMASVIFGPGGAGLHGIEEYVRIDEVLACRDALVETARRFCA
ncbi:MAG TPA: M20/M25/M40 family metallo-hydrolase [Thermoanaerobaculia bacterium]|nr:M20/M25/M40 family metallo-hydrolase [Thermoanaerobaculia bacterium]